MQDFKDIALLLGMLVSDPRTGVLVALLLAAAWIDLRTYRIPNWLTLSGLAFALIWNALHPASPDQGLVWALQGLAVAFALTLPLHVFGSLGAGDVKLMSMAGAFLGFPAALQAVLCSLAVGGIAALAFGIAHGALARMLGNVVALAQGLLISLAGGARPDLRDHSAASVGKLPYGVSIAVGTVTFLVLRQLGFL